MEDKDIYFTVEISISNKVVVGWVSKGDSFEGEVRTEIIKEVESGGIIWVAVSISSKKVGSFWVLVTCVLNVALELHKRSHELVLSATGGEVHNGVDGRKGSREGKQNR